MEHKWLLIDAEGDIDEDEGMTKMEILKMLASELGVKVVLPRDS